MTNAKTAIGLVLFIIILGIGAAIITSLDTSTRITELQAQVVNETLTLDNATAVPLNRQNIAVVSYVLNATNNETISTGNYTMDLPAGTIILTAGSPFNASAALITYTWNDLNASTTSTNITSSGLNMFNNMTGLIPVLGIVFLAGLVIFFVIRGLGGTGKIAIGGGRPAGGNF